MNVNIFSEGKTVSVEWFYFKNIGDQVQGTYIGKLVGLKDSFGNDQIVYELSTKTGIKRVGFRTTQKINKNMDYINFGQIIGFKFVSKDKFMNKVLKKEQEYKNVQVFADAKIVDQEWLDSQKNGRVENVSHEGGDVSADQPEPGEEAPTPEITPDPVKGWGDFETTIPEEPAEEPVKKAVAKKAKTVEEKLVEIAELAKTKLSVIDPNKVKEAVMEATELAFITSNYDKIITALKALA